jgi:hypothetical protein
MDLGLHIAVHARKNHFSDTLVSCRRISPFSPFPVDWGAGWLLGSRVAAGEQGGYQMDIELLGELYDVTTITVFGQCNAFAPVNGCFTHA